MKINFSEKKIKDTFYSLSPLNLLLRSAGLSNIYRQGTLLAESGSIAKTIIYIFIGGLLNILVFYYKFDSFEGNRVNGLMKFSDAIQITYWFAYFEYITDMYSVYKYGRGFLLKYFQNFDNIDALLGVPCYDGIRSTLMKNVASSLVMFFIIFSFDYASWVYIEGWFYTTVYSIEYLYFCLNIFTILDIVSHVIQVEYRLKIIRDLLQVIAH